MSFEKDTSQIHQFVDIGQTVQTRVSSTQMGIAATVGASSSVNSNVIVTNGYKCFSFGITSTQAGSISIQRYIDVAGTIKVGTAITATLTASTAQYVTSTDAIPYQSMIITISNTSASSATLSNEILLLQSQ